MHYLLRDLFQHKQPDPIVQTQATQFDHLMKMAEEIACKNPNALIDFIRALLRPIQSEHLIAVAEREIHTAPNSINDWSFFFNLLEFGRFSVGKYQVNPSPKVIVHLARDPVLPTPWHRDRYCDALAYIGTGKLLKQWKQDVTNHRVSVWLPWGIVFVGGGNHSIAAGILAGEGTLEATEVFDLRPLLDQVECDGHHYLDRVTKANLAAVTDYRRAAVFEIGRLMQYYGVLAFEPLG